MIDSCQILVVETDHDTRVLYRKALEEAGYVVCSTTTGKDGLDKLRKYKSSIKLVLLAINMPIMDGNDFLKIKSANPIFAEIPVIVITVQPKSVLYPVGHIVQKPPEIPELIELVKKILP